MTDQQVEQREPIGLKDVTGKDICLGDIVEFYLCPNHGPSDKPTPCAARIVDAVLRIDTKTPIPGHSVPTYYFWNVAAEMFGQGGAYAHRFAKFSKIIGKLPEDAELLLGNMPWIVQPQGPVREKLLKDIRAVPLAKVEE
jgi:hypothetical protein